MGKVVEIAEYECPKCGHRFFGLTPKEARLATGVPIRCPRCGEAVELKAIYRPELMNPNTLLRAVTEKNEPTVSVATSERVIEVYYRFGAFWRVERRDGKCSVFGPFDSVAEAVKG